MICKEQFMITLAISYNSIKSSWSLATDLIDNDTVLIENLTIHSYDTDISEKYHRKFNQIKLVDCVELDLKNTKNYMQAVRTFIELVQFFYKQKNGIIYLTYILSFKITRN
ncbi:hypothetical protein RhiirC2_759820 [Rhizophagus irregularis]|uniref:Uncharacterized protein n=1 Tax=Rhizophagus irregularis TaxID=588596 RepID=A0A2N1MKS8_9GLOM|nr:hypothetical protein RhiirC2_759820 [Rhizophagus irregularis]